MPPAQSSTHASPNPKARVHAGSRILLAALGTALGISIALAASRTAELDPALLLRRAWYRATAPSGLEIYQDDAVLGWTHRANSRRRHRTSEFDVLYSIGPDGGRAMPDDSLYEAPPGPDTTKPSAQTGRALPSVAIYGGSFSFGHGVEDDETWPALLAAGAWSGRARIRNRAVSAYGSGQVLLALERDLGEAGLEGGVDLAIYGWIYAHDTRSGRRKSWAEAVAPALPPVFGLDAQGRPVYEGLLHLSDAVALPEPGPIESELRLTDALVAEMARAARAGGAELAVVMLPFATRNPQRALAEARMLALLRAQGIRHLDLSEDPNLQDGGLFYEADVHPKAEWQRRVAKAVAAGLKLPPQALGE
jgi:hypothetical protein